MTGEELVHRAEYKEIVDKHYQTLLRTLPEDGQEIPSPKEGEEYSGFVFARAITSIENLALDERSALKLEQDALNVLQYSAVQSLVGTKIRLA